MKCEICNKQCKSLGTHLRYNHKEYSQERYYREFINTNPNIGICKLDGCNNKTRFWKIGIGYSTYCCNSHAQLDSDVRNKIKETNLQRYGCETALCSNEIQEKSRKTKLERYGDELYNNREKCVDTMMNRDESVWENWREGVKKAWENKTQDEIDEIHERANKTCIKNNGKSLHILGQEGIQEKYGVHNISCIPEIAQRRGITIKSRWKNDKELILEKSRNTMMERYGYEHIMCNEEEKHRILNKARETRTKNGTALPPEKIREYNRYKGRVYSLTERNIMEKFSKEELSKRGRCGIAGAIQVDHMFTIKDGFLNNIPEKIIACKSNLQLLSWEENDKKTKSDITLEELINSYNNEKI